MKNKKGMISGILLLVLGTLALTGLALFNFNLRASDVSETINVINLNGIYSREVVIDFYVSEAISRALGSGREGFVERFNNEIDKYKIGEFTLNDVGVSDGFAYVDYTVRIEQSYWIDGKESKVSYNYNKRVDEEIGDELMIF
jgi:hypothetical protein